jgi:glycogen debranching enzyme
MLHVTAMAVGPDVLHDLDRAAALEWLVTDGRGGFLMGTAAGMNTRRYHGWCVSLRPPVERYVLISRLEESVGDVELATNQYPGAIHPRGHLKLVRFDREPCPTWTWDLGGLRVTKQLFLSGGAFIARYRASAPCELRVRPMLAFRDYHGLQKANDALDRRWSERPMQVKPYDGLPAVRVTFDGTASHAGEGWYYVSEYREERHRGLDFMEDLWCMGTLTLKLDRERDVVFSLAEPPRGPQPRLQEPPDVFRVTRADGQPTLIAGYPWFTDWGRDTMISLRGLLIARGLHDEARKVLRAFLSHLDQGLIPNRFPDRAEKPEYNTADATLWLFEAAEALGYGPELFDQGREIVSWHERGTHFGIHVDPSDGLLVNGPQTTWMDAVFDRRPVTPRGGKAVEINALWFNALRLMATWAGQVGRRDEAEAYEAKAQRVAGAFRRTFWNASRGCLDDLAGDASLRPNQLFAAALTYSPLSVAEMQSMLRVAEARLLTPFGLRTLAPGESGYMGRYDGGPQSRDGAYHQGTVWPWLIGPYVDASLAAFGGSVVPRCRAALAPLLRVLEETGSVPEVYDGDAPHRPGGTPAQAWSVAEVLRARARLDSLAK